MEGLTMKTSTYLRNAQDCALGDSDPNQAVAALGGCIIDEVP